MRSGSAQLAAPHGLDEAQPGAYVAVFVEGVDADLVSFDARRSGLVLRDTILAVAGERVSFILLFKRPSGRAVADDAEVGVGVLNISVNRVGEYRNPNAFEGYERVSQVGRWGMRASKSRPSELSADRRYSERGGTDFALKPGKNKPTQRSQTYLSEGALALLATSCGSSSSPCGSEAPLRGPPRKRSRPSFTAETP